jgi:ABC-2 type transport system permease protein
MLERGVITLGACLVLLVIAQRIFTRLENKLPERL